MNDKVLKPLTDEQLKALFDNSMKTIIKAENVRQVMNINDLKAKMFDEILDYALDEKCDNDILGITVINFGLVIDMVNDLGAMD